METSLNKLFNNVLKLNISPNAIADVYTIKYKDVKNSEQEAGNKKSSSKNTVIVRFTSHRDRQIVLGNRKHLKGSGIRIYEELSKDTLMLYKKTVSKYSGHNVWTFQDKVFVKINDVVKRIYIEDFQE